MGVDGLPRWLFTIRFSNKDQSIYIIPLINRECIVKSIGLKKQIRFTHFPGSDFHLSLHESGIVNLTTCNENTRLCEDVNSRKYIRHIVTFQINNIKNLQETTLEEIKNPKGGHQYLPIIGFPQAPIMLTIFCAMEPSNWSPSSLGNGLMMHYKSKMKGKDYNFHFVIWQNLEMHKGPGDIGLKFGGEDDDLYGI